MMINGTVLSQWSRTRASRPLRTAEAKYYAVVTATADGLGVHSIMEDLACSQVRVWTGSHVAKASASRSGLGTTDILKYLWLRVTMSGRAHIHIHRVPGERNLAEDERQHVARD